jgi:streptogramin lyase
VKLLLNEIRQLSKFSCAGLLMSQRSMLLLGTIGLAALSPNCCAFNDAKFERVEVIVGGILPDEGGTWNSEDSPLLRPFGIDFNNSGQMYIVELEGGRVFQLTGTVQPVKLSGDGSKSYRRDWGPLVDATYNGMHNCAVTSNGDIFIADSWNHCIRKVDAKTAIVSTFAGTGKGGFSGDGGPAVDAAFDFIMCITLNHSGELLHVADLKNRRIREIDLKSGLVTTIAGNGKRGVPVDGSKATEAPLEDPRAVASDSRGNVYILERNGNALRVVRTDGTIHTVAGDGTRGFKDGDALQSQFGSPKHICVDDKDNVFIADDENKAIRKYDPVSGKVTTVLGRGFGEKKLQLLHPHGVCWQKDWLYVLDTSHNRILRLKP